jgi:hypothetical protein
MEGVSRNAKYHKFKFFRQRSQQVGDYKWKWPFIDVAYYKENDTHVWEYEYNGVETRIADFYPLQLRPFGSLWLPSPYKTREYLRKKYGRQKSMCKLGTDHQQEQPMEQLEVDCWKLTDDYPFVWRNKSRTGVIETLKINDYIIHQVEVVGNPDNISEPLFVPTH